MSAPIAYPSPPLKITNTGRYIATQVEAGNANSLGSGEGYTYDKNSKGTTLVITPDDVKNAVVYSGNFNPNNEYFPNEIIHLTYSIAFSYVEPKDGQTKTGTTPSGSYICIQHVPFSRSADINTEIAGYVGYNAVRNSGILYFPIFPEPQTTGSLSFDTPIVSQSIYWKQMGGSSGTSGGNPVWLP